MWNREAMVKCIGNESADEGKLASLNKAYIIVI